MYFYEFILTRLLAENVIQVQHQILWDFYFYILLFVLFTFTQLLVLRTFFTTLIPRDILFTNLLNVRVHAPRDVAGMRSGSLTARRQDRQV